jgi:hypothetical protein
VPRRPLHRTPIQSSGGSALPASDCTGVVSLDLNAFAQAASGGHPALELLVPGTTVRCQVWSRDPSSSYGTNVSSALRYVVLP